MPERIGMDLVASRVEDSDGGWTIEHKKAAMKRVEDAQAATREHEAAAGGGARKKNVQAVD